MMVALVKPIEGGPLLLNYWYTFGGNWCRREVCEILEYEVLLYQMFLNAE